MHFLAFHASLRLPPLPSSPRDPQPLLGICVIRLIFCTHLHTGQLRMMLLADFLERIRSCQPKKEFISKKKKKKIKKKPTWPALSWKSFPLLRHQLPLNLGWFKRCPVSIRMWAHLLTKSSRETRKDPAPRLASLALKSTGHHWLEVITQSKMKPKVNKCCPHQRVETAS